jgi:hypothetical protein
MARQSPQRTDPPSTGPRHRRYRVLATLPALLLLASGAYLGVALGNWILFAGAALYLLIAVVMVASDIPPTPPDRPDRPPDTANTPPGRSETDEQAEEHEPVPTPTTVRSSSR